MEIKILYKQGKSIRQIARETGLSKNTVKKYLRRNNPPKYKKRDKKPSKLEEYKEYLEERVNGAHPHTLPATVLLKEIQEQGYQGQITILRVFLRKIQTPKGEKIIRYETAPGEQMQVDWWEVRKGQDPTVRICSHSGIQPESVPRIYQQYE